MRVEIEAAADSLGCGWLGIVFAIAAILTAGAVLRAASGHVGDYVTWLVLGVACFGALSALLLR